MQQITVEVTLAGCPRPKRYCSVPSHACDVQDIVMSLLRYIAAGSRCDSERQCRFHAASLAGST
jgi:hypothetical protein